MDDGNQDTAPGETGRWQAERQVDRAARRQDRIERGGRHRSGWLWGTVLIVLGVVLLLENMGFTFTDNWWALFILIPAFGSLVSAWDQYRDNQRLTRGAAGSLMGGLLLTLLTVVFFFGIDFGIFWPALLILVGLALLSVGLVPA